MELMRKLGSHVVFRFFLSLGVSVLGGLLFTAIHTPIPWLLGPMVFIFAWLPSRQMAPHVACLHSGLWHSDCRLFDWTHLNKRGTARHFATTSHDASDDLAVNRIVCNYGLHRFKDNRL